MDLLPEEVRRVLPKLYSQEHVPDPIVFVKYSTPDSGWTWFATEGEEEDGDFRFFGYIIGHEEEWGYLLLSELQSATGPLGLSIERDLYFISGPLMWPRQMSIQMLKFNRAHGRWRKEEPGEGPSINQ